MPRRASIADARKHLAELVREAEAGRPVQITRRGEPVAVLVSVDAFEQRRTPRPRFADVYEALRRRFDASREGVDRDWAASLRDPSPGRPVRL